MKYKIWMQEHRQQLLVGVPVFCFLIIIFFYIFGGRYVSTDDAYVKAGKAAISSNVPGQVVAIYVRDNQLVKRDTPLFKLDDRLYKIAVADAKAQLDTARLQVKALKATYKQQLANLQDAKQTYLYQKQEFLRQEKLAAAGITSQMQLNKAKNIYQSAAKQSKSAAEQLANVMASLGNNANIPTDEHPLVQRANTLYSHALLKLSYTEITAPIDGVVTKVEELQPGDYINAGAAVFALISTTNIWIEANYKETDITRIQQGQKATIEIDAYPKIKFTGTVLSLSPGTGSSFSLLPPENATGNWVKIVQRLPIRIGIDNLPQVPFLKSGLSAYVTIDTGHARLFSSDKNA